MHLVDCMWQRSCVGSAAAGWCLSPPKPQPYLRRLSKRQSCQHVNICSAARARPGVRRVRESFKPAALLCRYNSPAQALCGVRSRRCRHHCASASSSNGSNDSTSQSDVTSTYDQCSDEGSSSNGVHHLSKHAPSSTSETHSPGQGVMHACEDSMDHAESMQHLHLTQAESHVQVTPQGVMASAVNSVLDLDASSCRTVCDFDRGLIHGATVRFSDSSELTLRRRAVVMWDQVTGSVVIMHHVLIAMHLTVCGTYTSRHYGQCCIYKCLWGCLPRKQQQDLAAGMAVLLSCSP